MRQSRRLLDLPAGDHTQALLQAQRFSPFLPDILKAIGRRTSWLISYRASISRFLVDLMTKHSLKWRFSSSI
jgi:hypothetical protein